MHFTSVLKKLVSRNCTSVGSSWIVTMRCLNGTGFVGGIFLERMEPCHD